MIREQWTLNAINNRKNSSLSQFCVIYEIKTSIQQLYVVLKKWKKFKRLQFQLALINKFFVGNRLIMQIFASQIMLVHHVWHILNHRWAYFKSHQARIIHIFTVMAFITKFMCYNLWQTTKRYEWKYFTEFLYLDMLLFDSIEKFEFISSANFDESRRKRLIWFFLDW